jgi:hypothetical protein
LEEKYANTERAEFYWDWGNIALLSQATVGLNAGALWRGFWF